MGDSARMVYRWGGGEGGRGGLRGKLIAPLEHEGEREGQGGCGAYGVQMGDRGRGCGRREMEGQGGGAVHGFKRARGG